WKRRRDLVTSFVILGSNLGPTLSLRNIYFTPTVDFIPFAFLVEEVALVFPEDILSETMEHSKGGEIW
ncbi:MAG: hypothetical protein ACK559_28790, partial [bacterium]